MEREIRRLPLLLAGFCAGILGGVVLFGNREFIFAPLLLLPLSLIRDKRPLAVCGAMLAALFLTGLHLRIPAGHLIHTAGHAGIATLEGTVADEPDRDHFTLRVILDTDRTITADGSMQTVSGLAAVKVPPSFHPRPGDHVRLEGVVMGPIPAPLNPGAFDRRDFWERKKIFCEGTARQMVVLGSRRSIIGEAILKTRESARTLLANRLRYLPEERELAEALCLGVPKIPPFLREIGVRTGTYHLLVISGLNIGFIYLLLRVFFFPFFVFRHRHPKVFPVFALLVLWYYTGITGMNLPVVRATLMFSFYLLGEIFEREITPMDSLMLTAFLLLAVNPLNLFDIGFQLSFAATAGILLISRRFGRFSGRGWLANDLLVTLGAQLFTLPVLLAHFQRFYPLSLADNIIAIPLAGMTTMAGFLFFLCPPVFAFPFGVLLTLTLRILTFLAGFAPQWTFLPPPAAVFLLFCGVLLLLFREDLRTRTVLFSAAAALLVLTIVTLLPRPVRHRIVFFSSRQPLVAIEANRELLLFASDDDPRREIERVVVPFMKKEGIRTVAIFFATGSSADQMGTVLQLQESVRLGAVGRLPDAQRLFSRPYAAARLSVPVTTLAAGTTYRRDGWEISLIAWNEKDGPVFRITRGTSRILLVPFWGVETGNVPVDGRYNALAVYDGKFTKKTRESIEKIHTFTLILPKNLKKFLPLRPTTAREPVYLSEGAVILDLDRSPLLMTQPAREQAENKNSR